MNDSTKQIPQKEPDEESSNQQTHAAWLNKIALHEALHALLAPPDLSAFASSRPESMAQISIHSTTPKVEEIERQSERLRLALELAKKLDDNPNLDAFRSSIEFLNQLATNPIPIPVASWDPEEGPNLFFEFEDFYGDVGIDGNRIEYFLKMKGPDGDQEYFDEEEMESGRIPPKLLGLLFSRFARNSADLS